MTAAGSLKPDWEAQSLWLDVEMSRAEASTMTSLHVKLDIRKNGNRMIAGWKVGVMA
jgi:hypothetical protein